jgi:hypothetical protein
VEVPEVDEHADDDDGRLGWETRDGEVERLGGSAEKKGGRKISWEDADAREIREPEGVQTGIRR